MRFSRFLVNLSDSKFKIVREQSYTVIKTTYIYS